VNEISNYITIIIISIIFMAAGLPVSHRAGGVS